MEKRGRHLFPVLGGLILCLVCSSSGPGAQAAGGDKEVLIANAPASPVPVRDINARQLTPVMIHGIVDYGAIRSPALYTVPAGKRLVLQQVNLDVIAETTSADWNLDAEVLAVLTTDRAGFGEQYTLHLDRAAVFSNGRGGFEHYLEANTPVVFYVDAGTTLGFFKASAAGGATRLTGTLVGYLVDAP